MQLIAPWRGGGRMLHPYVFANHQSAFFVRPLVNAAPLVLQAPWWSEGPEVFLFFRDGLLEPVAALDLSSFEE